MATATGKGRCITCGKEKSAVRCEGCLQVFCFDHLPVHRQELSIQLDQIEVKRDLFRQTLTEQTTDPDQHIFIKQIDKWEEDSIRKIQQTAKECRQLVPQHTTAHINKIEVNLAKLTNQLRQIRQENDYNEIDLRQLTQKLTQLVEELDKPSNISIETNSASFVSKIFVVVSSDTKWKQAGITVAGGNGHGNQLSQLYDPLGIFIDNDQTIYIADWVNHRIVEWKSNATIGQIVAGGNGKGNQTNQLSGPYDVMIDQENNSFIITDRGNRRVMRWSRQNQTNGEIIISDIECWDLTMDQNGSLYVSDVEKNEVRRWKRWERNGTIVAGGNGQGDQLKQLNGPTFIFVDENYSLYVSDCRNHRVMKWVKDAQEGIVVAGGNGKGNSLTQLSSPQGVIVDQLGQIYVADERNHRVMRWYQGSKEGTIVVGGNGQGGQSNQLDRPTGLSFDREGNLYVADFSNHRIQKFEID